MMTDVMIDLETFGNGKNKCIVQIGACYFDRETGEIGETFKVNVNALTHVARGAQIDADTVYWWLKQDKVAQNSILAEPQLDIIEAFNKLNDFLTNAKAVWSHLGFDWVTISDTFKELGITPKFHYRVARDLRTIVDAGKVSVDDFPREGIHHDGLDDCKHQVKYCVAAFKNIKKRSEG